MLICQMLLACQYLCLSGFTTVIDALGQQDIPIESALLAWLAWLRLIIIRTRLHVCTGRGEEGLQQSEDKAKGS